MTLSIHDHQSQISSQEAERRDGARPGNRFLGRVVACNGNRATVAATSETGGTELTELWSVGALISISVQERRVVALVASMRTANGLWAENEDNGFMIEVELMGEVSRLPDGTEDFSTGISAYPHLGAVAHRIRAADLARIYHSRQTGSCVIGHLTQDERIAATLHIPTMLSKHFAVVGSTGVGKSTAVSLLLRKAIEQDPKLRVLILDPHNEFSSAFPDQAMVIDTDTLDLPFWLMRLDEFAEVLYRGRPVVPEEVDILRELIAEARRNFRGSDAIGMRRAERVSYTADTPVPYRLADLLSLLDERGGRLDGRDEKPYVRAVKLRILAAVNDPRYRFMFSNNTVQDTILETVAHIFRIPGDGRPIAAFQLAGVPSEVVNSVVSVLCRMAFELALWSNGALHMLVVCEEAHRYVPADLDLGFFPTRQAIARIAKEGRKYGVSLGIVTQRPGELDQTILSQCSTVFAMRLANERDQEIIRSALPDSTSSTTSFISAIGNGEAIAFGEAMPVPMRMRFLPVETRALPKASGHSHAVTEERPDSIDLTDVIARMRSKVDPDIAALQARLSPQEREASRIQEDRPSAAPVAPLPKREMNPFFAAGSGEDTTPIEPYRPDMLPRAPADPLAPPRPETGRGFSPQSAYATLRNAETSGMFATAPSPAVPRRDASATLRDSFLKKPPVGPKSGD